MGAVRETQLRAAFLGAVIARQSPAVEPHIIAAHVIHLQRIARQAVTIAVNLCNLPDYQETFDARMATLQRHSAKIAGELGTGYKVALGGDPRGACCYLTIPGARGDGWGDPDQFAVY